LEENILGRNVAVFVLALSMLIAISSVPLVGVFQQSGSHNVVIGTQVESIPADYELAALINITSDDEFNTTIWSGSGIEGDPYLVENLNITSDADCVSIVNTTKHFEIRNCFFTSASTPYSCGVHLHNVTNGAVRNCIIRGKNTGIICHIFNNSIISENTIFNCTDGILADSISNVSISGNTVYNNKNGMLFFLAINSDVVHNTVFNCTLGGVVLSVNANISRFAHNTVHSIKGSHSMESGIQMYGSPGWIVEENTLYDNYCSMDIVWVEDCLVRNNDISNSSKGIDAVNVNSSVFDGNTFSDCGSAVVFRECNDCVLSENTLSDIDYRGMEILDCLALNLTGNSLDRCGITIDGLTVLKWRHVVIDNTVNGKELGYFVDESDMVIDGTVYGAIYLVNCAGVTVQNGEFHNGSMGVCIAFSDHCEVVDCEVQGHLYGGIRLFYSEDCVLERNIIHNNTRYWIEGYGGIDLGFAANCKITRNRIYWNWGSGISIRYGMTAVNCTIVNNASVDRYPNVLPNGTPSFPLDPVGGFSVEFLILAGGGVIIAAIVLFVIFKRRRIP
jgi:parallel beta-helix repeat protein